MSKKTFSYNVIGVMSGTSLDGIDICFAKYSFKNENWKFKIICTQTTKYDNDWFIKLSTAYKLSKEKLLKLDLDYSLYLGNQINKFIKRNKLINIDFISSHGHTIFHDPKNRFTFQLGNLIELKKTTRLNVVCDFRKQDIELGGQGAPLVPIGDLLLFKDYTHCINLGGFSNITVKSESEIIAYDICPVNVVLNHYSRIAGHDYDYNGIIAKSGKINQELLLKLNKLSYYKKDYPKSLGIEWVHKNIYPLINSFDLSVKDILRTYIQHISIQISKKIIGQKTKTLFTGGGVKNIFLMSELEKNSNKKIQIAVDEIIDFKEALVFGFLGVLKIRNQNNCLKSVTGALKDHSSGVVFD